ncbi:DUF3558 domain-containing protein [Streptomyces sp. TS71-3]|uniref:DUF3558 domain-containing protein n=1 Tax=Streptomyces sp. TS71-3 TaxID=2733862 RepID=UPI001B03E75C|nr:DUF3558 domain-containing protein [Streptomyces sp. TS71-3]GHJ34793.1 hypothetical protein Sm713_04020 [Streptomyces sp. TS71-3]
MTGSTALLAALVALLAGCTADSGSRDASGDAKPAGAGTSAPPAPPGKYRTLPEPCGEVEKGSLDTMLPGIKTISDEQQRERAYEGSAALTYDTDRRVGCRWSGESPYATDHLLIDFERVVSYDTTVSDDTRAQQVFSTKETDAGLTPSTPPGKPQKGSSSSPSASAGAGGSGGSAMNPDSLDAGDSGVPGGSCAASGTGGSGAPAGPGATGSSGLSGAGVPPSRALNGLGDAAFLDDTCSSPSSAARHRTVTVVFRTSNVIVTVQYDEQAGNPTLLPDSKKMQDSAQDLAHELAGRLSD